MSVSVTYDTNVHANTTRDAIGAAARRKKRIRSFRLVRHGKQQHAKTTEKQGKKKRPATCRRREPCRYHAASAVAYATVVS